MVSLGIITVTSAGTPVQLSTTSKKCNTINFQPVKSLGPKVANAGVLYVGDKTLVKAGGVGVFYALAPDQPGATVHKVGLYGDDVSNYWIDADTSGDGVLVSYD